MGLQVPLIFTKSMGISPQDTMSTKELHRFLNDLLDSHNSLTASNTSLTKQVADLTTALAAIKKGK
jgi:hypothetical protein